MVTSNNERGLEVMMGYEELVLYLIRVVRLGTFSPSASLRDACYTCQEMGYSMAEFKGMRWSQDCLGRGNLEV
jgi:hypothetical protein